MMATKQDIARLESRIAAFEIAVNNIEKDREIKLLRAHAGVRNERSLTQVNQQKAIKQVEDAERRANQMHVKHTLERKQLVDTVQQQKAALDAKQAKSVNTLIEDELKIKQATLQRRVRSVYVDRIETANQEFKTELRANERQIYDVSKRFVKNNLELKALRTETDGADLEHRIVEFELTVSNIRKDEEIKQLREKLHEMEETRERKYEDETEDTDKSQRVQFESNEEHYKQLVATVEERTLGLAKMQQTMLDTLNRLEAAARRCYQDDVQRATARKLCDPTEPYALLASTLSAC